MNGDVIHLSVTTVEGNDVLLAIDSRSDFFMWYIFISLGMKQASVMHLFDIFYSIKWCDNLCVAFDVHWKRVEMSSFLLNANIHFNK